MKVNRLKKLLYLFQLEEYSTERFDSWLNKNSIEHLEERKNKLRFTLRAILIFGLSLPLSLFLSEEKSIKFADRTARLPSKMVEKIIILAARAKLNIFQTQTRIVITGSYGKTTFKEMLSSILEAKYSVFKTSGNINTEIGIALEILKNLKKNQKIMVIEAGAYQKGEIKNICRLVKPNFGVITVIGWMHLERFMNIDNIRSTKFEIAEFIRKKENFFYPLQDHQFINFEATIRQIAARLLIPKSIIKEKIKNFDSPAHRLTINELNKRMVLLDDTYNSNPLGFQKALKKLEQYREFQKIVVTPGMIEFGAQQDSMNKTAGFLSAKTADILVIIGQTNQESLLNGAKKLKKKSLKIILLGKNDRYEEKISSFLKPPTVILLENDLPDHYF